jgi:hypothetical protein
MSKAKALTILLYAGLLFCVWSCTTPAGRTAGQVIDDATITTKVKAKFLVTLF